MPSADEPGKKGAGGFMKLKQAGFLTKIVVLALMIYMAISLLDMRSQIQETRALKETLERQVSSQRVENQRLADAVEHSDDPAVMEQVAREKGFVKQGEVLYIDVAN